MTNITSYSKITFIKLIRETLMERYNIYSRLRNPGVEYNEDANTAQVFWPITTATYDPTEPSQRWTITINNGIFNATPENPPTDAEYGRLALPHERLSVRCSNTRAEYIFYKKSTLSTAQVHAIPTAVALELWEQHYNKPMVFEVLRDEDNAVKNMKEKLYKAFMAQTKKMDEQPPVPSTLSNAPASYKELVIHFDTTAIENLPQTLQSTKLALDTIANHDTTNYDYDTLLQLLSGSYNPTARTQARQLAYYINAHYTATQLKDLINNIYQDIIEQNEYTDHPLFGNLPQHSQHLTKTLLLKAIQTTLEGRHPYFQTVFTNVAILLVETDRPYVEHETIALLQDYQPNTYKKLVEWAKQHQENNKKA